MNRSASRLPSLRAIATCWIPSLLVVSIAIAATFICASGHAAPTAGLRVVTYNVLADPWKVEKRIPDLMRALDESDADIIALQEVAPWFARKLEAESWISEYEYPANDGKLQIAHEFVILSKLPVIRRQTLPLPSKQGRIAFFTTVRVNDEELTIVTCHLDSFLEDGPMRARQLETIFANLENARESILLGDFNFGDGEVPDTKAIPAAFVDPWQRLRPSEPGYTWDRELNPKARRDSFPGEKSRRLDRVLIRSKNWIPTDIRIIGNDAIPNTRPALFPSDHFSVMAVFQPKK